MNVALLDYGAGNLHSLAKAIDHCGARPVITSEWPEALGQDALVLPGVGAFGAAVAALPRDPAVVRGRLLEGYPCLGICLGMQLLCETSEEGAGRGIGLFHGQVHRLDAARVPHMGWNTVVHQGDPLFRGTTEPVVYFANSYVCSVDDDDAVIGWTDYGDGPRPSAIRRGKTWGVQFHPEKSSTHGLAMIRNFLETVR